MHLLEAKMRSRVRWTFFLCVIGAVATAALGACGGEDELPARDNTKRDAAAGDATTGPTVDGSSPFDTGAPPVSAALCTKVTADQWRALGPLVKQDLADDCRTSAHLAGKNLARLGECMGHVFAAQFCGVKYEDTGCRDPFVVHRSLNLKTADFNFAVQTSFRRHLDALNKLTTAEENEAVTAIGSFRGSFNLKPDGDGGPHGVCSCAPGDRPQGGRDSCGRPYDAGVDARVDSGNDAASPVVDAGDSGAAASDGSSDAPADG